MHKRILPVVALGAAATLGLAACAGGSTGGSTDGEGQELTVWIMKGTNPDSSAFYDAVSTAFEEKTGATVNIEEVQWADAHDRFVTSIAGGTTPDIAETGTTWTAEFADAGALLDLDEYVDGEKGLRDDLVEGLAVAGTYEEKLYGMPWYAGVRSLVYRTDVFEELGLEAPKNWDDIVAAGEAIKAAHPDMLPFPVPGDAEFQVYPWVWGAGGEIATLDGKTWTSELDSAESQAGIEFYTDLATKHGFSSAGATTWKETDLRDAFTQGNVAMMLSGSWTPKALIEANPDLDGKIGAAVIPGQDGGIAPSVLGGSHLSVFNTTKNADLAWEFVKLMTTGEFAEQWADETGYFPGVQSAMEEALASTDPLVAPFADQMVNGGASVPVTPNFGAVQAKKTTNSMIQAILGGQKDVKTATKDAAAEMTDLLNK
ncbi:sugar ABC transporter substrate-binding protein [Microbacterium saperdae]|uniref:Carbohydrate ABC transporter substrate-binding protein (CUT1 family) n=1 Tax=Microbacterium saperdae TaxID=69368 RepID=A0A543BCT4_9MICO|nr:sugar ABC transporter substrate-binding protein [Microbacterium saperdae]TQL82655.1 carbohydrate ABC transporter substrate-binding protein (CUT1 family) [Microbacterium saperdae]GGM41648.1 sugar ABC transporter substrate-binding protein [Microbacterium saperdae]